MRALSKVCTHIMIVIGRKGYQLQSKTLIDFPVETKAALENAELMFPNICSANTPALK